MNGERMSLLLFLLVFAAGSGRAQTSDLVDITGTFAPDAPVTLYSSPGEAFSADITVPNSLTYDSSDTYSFNGSFSPFRYRLNGGTPVVVDNPFAFTSGFFSGTTNLIVQNSFRLTAATATPFFLGSFDSSIPLIPGTYALTDASGLSTVAGITAPIASGTMTISPVPEPSTLFLVGSATVLGATGAFLRRRRPAPRPVGGGGSGRGGT